MAKNGSKRVLITGGAGFIGSHVANELLKRDFDVLVCDNLKKGKRENLKSDVKLFEVDIKSPKFILALKKYKPHYLFHFAAQTNLTNSIKHPLSEFQTNFLPIIAILNELKSQKIKKFIFASSAAVYGEAKSFPIKEDHEKNPTSPYGLAKLATENYINYFCKFNNIPHITYRFSNVYGPKQTSTEEGGVVAIFMKKMIKNNSVIIYGDGKQERDFIFISDVVSAVIQGVENDISGTFNISTSKTTSINKLYDIISKVASYSPNKAYELKADKGVGKSSLSNEKFLRSSNWKPLVDLKEGLKETFEFFKGTRK